MYYTVFRYTSGTCRVHVGYMPGTRWVHARYMSQVHVGYTSGTRRVHAPKFVGICFFYSRRWSGCATGKECADGRGLCRNIKFVLSRDVIIHIVFSTKALDAEAAFERHASLHATDVPHAGAHAFVDVRILSVTAICCADRT